MAMMAAPTVSVQVRDKIDLTDKERMIFDLLLRVVDNSDRNTQLRVAGGWVRDKLLGKESKDIDIALNMGGVKFCEEINSYLSSRGEVKREIVKFERNPEKSKHLEVARLSLFDISIDFVNLRTEDYCESSSIPGIKIGTPKEDAYGRDLTINSLFYNIHTSSVEDFTGKGIEDLKSGKIVTPLPPKKTFLDNPFRVFRAIRFGVRLGFTLDEELQRAASDNDVKTAIKHKVPRGRIRDEVDLMMICGNDNQSVKAMTYISDMQLFWVVFLLPPKIIEPSSSDCVACMHATWRLMQLGGFSTFNDEQRRLSLVAALFLPLRKSTYKANEAKKILISKKKKAKTFPVVSYILHNSLNLNSSDGDKVVSLHSVTEKCKSLIPLILSHEDVQTAEVDWKREIIDDPVLLKLKVLSHLLLQETKNTWRVALLLLTSLHVTSVESIANSWDEHFRLFKIAENMIETLDLEKISEVKPMFSGGDIISLLQLKRRGPIVRECKQKVLEWQLAHPLGTIEECMDWMRQTYSAHSMKVVAGVDGEPGEPSECVPPTASRRRRNALKNTRRALKNTGALKNNRPAPTPAHTCTQVGNDPEQVDIYEDTAQMEDNPMDDSARDDDAPVDGEALTSSFSRGATNPSVRRKHKEKGPLRCRNPAGKILEWSWWSRGNNARFADIVQQSGLSQLAHCTYRFLNMIAISGFVERWKPETNTFHLTVGEMTITLDDVSNILGVPITGRSVSSVSLTDQDALSLVVGALGVNADVAFDELSATGGNSVSLKWLRTTFENVSDSDSEEIIQFAGRAYLLYLLGCTFFSDKSGNRVPVVYLSFLMDLGSVHSYAWGAAGLAYLYSQLGYASRSGVRQIAGYLTLLEAWIYEHFRGFTSHPNMNYTEDKPRVYRWSPWRDGGPSVAHLRAFREKLDRLEVDEVTWDSYRTSRDRHPCHAVTFYHGYLKCLDIVEPYHPDRVLRQFGRVQLIPNPPLAPIRATQGATASQYKVMYAYLDQIWEAWDNHVLSIERSRPVRHATDCVPGYMAWYKKIRKFYVQNPEHHSGFDPRSQDYENALQDSEHILNALRISHPVIQAGY